MKRRTFLAGLGAAAATSHLPMPSLAQSSRSRTLVYTPAAGLLILDPIFTSITPTVNHGHYVFDMLYNVDSKFRPVPQMAEGHTVSDDNLTWNVRLRPGLKFHDGEPVLARDCVASIKRWGQRDGFGASLLAYSNEISAADDNTIRFRLKKPFGILPDALAHPLASPCCIMPERIASTEATKAVTEVVGSGPLRFIPGEFVPSTRAVYEKNTAYVPRQEKPDGMSGGKVVNFDRIEWRTLPDQATAAAAIQAGEIDWWEVVQFDLIDVLKRDRNVKVMTADAGQKNYIRFNCGTKPFNNNVALRRAVAAAVTQSEFTQSLVGSNPDLQSTCFAIYPCGFPGVEELGKGLMDGKKDFKALAEQVRKAGYNGEKIVLMSTADTNTLAPMGPVLADLFTKLGMNVEMQSVDLNTIVARRASQATVEQGGWSAFIFQASTAVMANPLTAIVGRGLGLKGYAGNYEDAELEADIAEWIAATTPQEQAATLGKVHQRLWDMAPIAPLGAYSVLTAQRADLTGYIPHVVPMPWSIRRA